MARIHDVRPVPEEREPVRGDERAVRLDAGQADARPARPAQPHGSPSAGGGAPPERGSEPAPSAAPAAAPDPDAPGEGIVHDEEPAEPNEPG